VTGDYNKEKVSYCMECYREVKLLTNNYLLTHHVSRADKTEALSLIGVPINYDDDIKDVDDLYEAMILNIQIIYDETIVQQISKI
jgi:hypothetical protein